MTLKYKQEAVLVCIYSKPKFIRQPPVIPFFILRGMSHEPQPPAPHFLCSLLYFFSFNIHPYLEATICLLPLQPTGSWKGTTKQLFQLWFAEGKKSSTFILQVLPEIQTCTIRTANQSKRSWFKPLRIATWSQKYWKGRKYSDLVHTFKTIFLKYLYRYYKQRKFICHPYVSRWCMELAWWRNMEGWKQVILPTGRKNVILKSGHSNWEQALGDWLKKQNFYKTQAVTKIHMNIISGS